MASDPTPQTLSSFRDDIKAGNIPDPLDYLSAVMQGSDPRATSGLYALATELDSFCGGNPSKADWSELMEYITLHHQNRPVNFNDSMAATKVLAEYVHPKRRQTDISIEAVTHVSPKDVPLTEEDIALFKEKFNAEF